MENKAEKMLNDAISELLGNFDDSSRIPILFAFSYGYEFARYKKWMKFNPSMRKTAMNKIVIRPVLKQLEKVTRDLRKLAKLKALKEELLKVSDSSSDMEDNE